MNFDSIGLQIPEILLPSPEVDKTAWAVVACDQYSSQPSYWEKVAQLTAGKPSTYHMIFPEVYLDQDDGTIIKTIHTHMRENINNGVLQPVQNHLVLCERTLNNGKKRLGVMVALDLEHYDYNEGAQTLIRATEGTIVDRLPPRVKIRAEAPLEFPHIMVLIDDPTRSVIEPLFAQASQELYAVELMQNGGHLRGLQVEDDSIIQRFAAALAALAEPNSFREKYHTDSTQQPLVYAMGDGNHSFATAKAIWEQMKTEQGFHQVANHPARYALVELVNLYDESLEFEPIHRVMFNTDADAVLTAFEGYCEERNIHVTIASDKGDADQVVAFCSQNRNGFLLISDPIQQLATGTLQQFIDHFLAQHPQAKVDYIHGDSTTQALANSAGNIGFLLPPISKDSLFKTVIFDGALPRKTFSMGDAEDKRYYYEARRLTT